MTTTAPDTDDGPQVRRARRADLVPVHRIEQAAFPQPWPYSAFESYLGEPGFLVAEDAGDGDDTGDEGSGHDADRTAEYDVADRDVVGYVVADTVPNHGTPLGHVKDIAVAADHRGEGLGSTLLRRALSVLDETGAATAKLEVRASNEGAIELYRQFGFEHRRTVPGYYGNGADALVMVTTLDD